MGRIALVDEDETFLALMRDVLTDGGYEVMTVGGRKRAWQLVAERQPDLIILGLRTGAERRDWQLLTRFALDPATSDIPLIICSGDLRLLEEKQAVLTRLGIGVLPKPFDPDELFYSVQAGLESRAAWWERA